MDYSPDDPVYGKLIRILGPEKGRAVIAETLEALGLHELRTPNERFVFGHVLTTRGGLLESIGRAIKIQSLLQGASRDAASAY